MALEVVGESTCLETELWADYREARARTSRSLHLAAGIGVFIVDREMGFLDGAAGLDADTF